MQLTRVSALYNKIINQLEILVIARWREGKDMPSLRKIGPQGTPIAIPLWIARFVYKALETLWSMNGAPQKHLAGASGYWLYS